MRPVLALAALGVLVVGSLAACSDDDPVRLPDGHRASFSLRPQLNSFGASQMLPINLIRLTVLSLPDSVQLMDPVEETVEPEDPSWRLHLDVPLEDGEPVQVIVLVELINETGGVRTVEWSGIAGPFDLEAGETSEPPAVDLFRGGLDNLSITAVFIEDDIDTSLLEGETLLLEAFANGATGVPQFFWSSLAPTVAEVDTAGGDSAVIRALLPGVARIVVEAGQHADTIQIDVGQRIASIVVNPANDTVDALDAQALFTAQALDPRGDPVPDVFFDWSSSDTLVARHTETGSFRAMGLGTATITASTPAAPGVTQTASLTVRQVVTSVTIAQPDTVLLPNETLALSATAADANGFTVAGATFTWTSSDTLVAAVNASGVVDPRSTGSAYIRAASGGGIDSVQVVVTTGPPATMTIVAGDDQTRTVGQTLGVDLVVVVEDAAGNPVQGIEVSWFGDGDFLPPSDATDVNGRASTEWTLDTIAGPQSATAATAFDLSATFSATATAGPVDSVDVAPDSLAFVALGATQTLTATSYDAFGNDCGCTPTWSSRNASVATVDGGGVVTSVGNGATWIVADVSGILDSAFVEVSAGARTITWTGATSADCYDPSNWSPAAVPRGIDTVAIQSGPSIFPILLADTGVAALGVASGTLTLDGAVLTVHGSISALGSVIGLAGGTLRVDGPAEVQGSLPRLEVYADAHQAGSITIAGDLLIGAGTFTAEATGASYPFSVAGDLDVNGGRLRMVAPVDGVSVLGDARFTTSGSIDFASGNLAVGGNLITTCDAWLASSAAIAMSGDSVYLETDCPGGTPAMYQIRLAGGPDQLVEFRGSWVASYVIASGSGVTLRGNGSPLVTNRFFLTDVTVEHLPLRLFPLGTDFSISGVNFTGFASDTLPQLSIRGQGWTTPQVIDAAFDPAGTMPYLELIDTGDPPIVLEVHVQSPNTDGPSRTSLLNGARAWWNGQPYAVVVTGGNGQTGFESVALTDSLYVHVHDVFGTPVVGATVEWAVTAGGGSVDPATAATDVNGDAQTRWILGTAGTTQSAVASVAGAAISAPFSATSVPAGGRVATWLGGTAGAEQDWHTASNWSIGVVPGVDDTVFVPAAVTHLPVMSADAYIASYDSEVGALLVLNGTVTLTVHGDALSSGGIVATGAGNVLFDVAGSTIEGGFPVLSIFADVAASGAVSATSVFVNAGVLSPAGQGIVVSDRLEVVGGTLSMTDPNDVVNVTGPAVFVDGQPAGTLTAGTFFAMSDLTNIGACGEFVATGTTFVLGGDTANVALDCPSALFDGNRFAHLTTTGGIDQQIFFNTHIIAERFTALGGGANVTLHGVATPIVARVIEINDATLDRLQLKQQTTSDLDGLNLLGVTFTNFAATSLTQLEVSRPGDSPIFVSATFDAGSDGQYIDAIDSDGIAPFVEMHVESPNVDGPTRTNVSGGAIVRWSGQPYQVVAIGGDGQSGLENTALPDSLRVRVLDVFGNPASGTLGWEVTSGGGSLSTTAVVLDVNGEAAAQWTLGPAFTPQVVRAAIAGAINEATFSATSFAGSPEATISWTGAVSNDWGNPGNWSTGSTPTPADTAFVPINAPLMPVVSAPAAVDGLILADGAVLTVDATLTLGAHLRAASSIVGTGVVLLSNTEVYASDAAGDSNSAGVVQLPAVDVAGQAFLWNRVSVTGGVNVLANAYLELTVGGLQTTGDVTVAGDNSYLGVFDSLLVGGSLTVGGTESAGVAHLENREVIVVTDSFHVAGRGRVEFGNAANLLRIGGNARWVSTELAEGWQPVGIIEIAGDWYQDGPSFHTPDLQTFFNGTAAPQTITHLNAGHGPGQGHFGPIHVSNPNGLTFLTPSLMRGDLTSDAAVPIVIDSLVIEGHVVASGDVGFTYLDTRSASVSGSLAGTTLRTAGIPSAGSFAVDTTIYRRPDIETATAPVNASLPYAVLTLEADSALFDGPATISGRMTVLGVTTLGGRTTAGEVAVEGLGELDLAGYTLDATGGSVAVGALSGTGIIPMDAATDSIIAEQVTFLGSSSEGRMSAGTIVATGFTANGLAFNATAGHTVVLDPRGDVVTNQVTLATPSIEDGVGARFGTLHIVGSAAAGVALNSDVAALNFVSDPGVLLVAAPGAQRAIMSDGTSVDGTTFRNVPLQVLGGFPGQSLAVDNATFEAFDAGSTQLEITHIAAIDTFFFTGMAFDPIPDGTSDGSLYVRATRFPSAVDANLRISIAASNVTNGETFTLDDDGTADVIWPNDVPSAPPPATIAWLGETSSDWFDASNWTGNRLPTGADTVHVFAAAPSQPILSAQDSIAGIILEPTASVTLNATLVVQNHVDAGTTISGPGVLRMRGGNVSGTVPTLEVAGTVSVAAPLTIDGDLLYVEDNATLYAFFPTTITGSAFLNREGAHLLVGDAVTITGSAEVGTVGAATIPEIDVSATLTIGGNLSVTDVGMIEMATSSALIDIEGNASFAGTVQTSGFLTQGTITLAGDFEAIGPAFYASGTLLVLDGAADQRITMSDPGDALTQSRLYDVAVIKSGGNVLLESDVLVVGVLSENLGFGLLDAGQLYTLTVRGDIDVAGDLMVDSLRFGGTNLNVGTSLSANTTEFFGTAQNIPSTYGLQNVVVSGSEAVWQAPGGAILGDLTVTGDLTLAAGIDVIGTTTIVGAVLVAGNGLATQDLTVAGGTGLVMTNALDLVTVRGAAEFLGGGGGLVTGTLRVEAGGSFHSVGDAFRSQGTSLHMQGASVHMENAGADPGQGMLTGLVIESPALLIDSAYVNGNVTEAAPSLVGDAGNPGPWRGLLRVDGDIVTPNTGYGLLHVAVSGDFQINANNMDVDTVEFTGTGQLVRVVDPVDLDSVPYSTILVTGPSVTLGNQFVLPSGEFTRLTADVVVRGAGVRLDLTSNAGGTIGSLLLEGGDQAQRVYLYGSGWTVEDSVVIASGVLDLNANTMQVNTSNAATVALHTLGSGAIEMNGPGEILDLRNGGNALFEGGSTDGLLTDGTIHTQPGSVFRSVGDAFRSTGTTLVMRGDTIDMIGSGPDAGQGQLANLDISKVGFIEVLDSLYVTGNLTDVRIGGSGLHDQGDDALIRVLGNVDLGPEQYVIDHFGIGGSFVIDNGANWAVDTTTFFGNNQVAPVIVSGGFTPISYNNVVFRGGGAIDFGTAADYLDQSGAHLHVRDAGTTVSIYSSDNGHLGSVVMSDGDALQRVNFVNAVNVWDSVHVASGVLGMSSVGVTANYNGVAPVAVRTTGTGIIELNEPFDQLYVPNGDVWFEGGQSVLSDGMFWQEVTPQFVVGVGTVSGTFHATGAAYQSSGTYTKLDVDSIVVIDGGPGVSQARFDKLEFYSGDLNSPTWIDGHAYVADSLIAAFSFSELNGVPGSQLTVLGGMATGSTYLQMPLLTVHDVLNAYQFGYNVDVTEFAGSGQAIDQLLLFDTILVTGSATRTVQIGGNDTIARVLIVQGDLALLGGSGVFSDVLDSLVIDGGVFDLNGGNLYIGDDFALDGGLVTMNGGILVNQSPGYLTLRGDAEFRGGSTEGRLTEGTFYFRGDFYAENGAFQASDNHFTFFDFNSNFITLGMPTGGAAGSGLDHFNHVGLSTNNVINVATDLWAIGNVSDNSDAPATLLVGTGQTFHADGWSVSGALAAQDVTIELDADLEPAHVGNIQMTDIDFVDYPSGATRMRIRHPGLTGSATIQIDGPDFALSQDDPGTYVHVVDSDFAGANPDTLNVLVYFSRTLGEPTDLGAPGRLVSEDGANLSTNGP